jgi:hypothetical protein
MVIKTQGSIRNGGRAVARSNGEGSVLHGMGKKADSLSLKLKL